MYFLPLDSFITSQKNILQGWVSHRLCWVRWKKRRLQFL